MTQQHLLFGDLHREPLASPAAKSRTTDPESSRAAAKSVNESGTANHQRQRCIDLVYQFPGLTSKQLATKCDDTDRYVFGRRLPEAEEAGEIHRVAEGRKELRWFPGGKE